MTKFLIGLLVLLIGCVAIGVFRWMKGGTFFPRNDQGERDSLRAFVEQRRAEDKK